MSIGGFAFVFDNTDTDNTDTNNIFSNEILSGIQDNEVRNTLVKNIITSALSTSNFTHAIISGKLLKEDIPADIIVFLNAVFYSLFYNKSHNEILYYDSESVDDTTIGSIKSLYVLTDINDVKKGILDVCSELQQLLDEVIITLNLAGKDDVMIKFLGTAIEYFISYTTEIFEFKFRNTVNSFENSVSITDLVRTNVNYTEIDSFYYDERLEIEFGGNNG